MADTTTELPNTEEQVNVSTDRRRAGLSQQRLRSVIGTLAGKYALLAILILLIIVFSALRPATFATSSNAILIASSQSVFLVLSIGLLFPLVAGEFDLSIGYNLGFTAMMLAVLSGQHHMNPVLAAVLTLLTGGVLGAVNAVLVLVARINAFIATLATGTVLQGLTLWLSGSAVVGGLPNDVANLGSARWGDLPVLAIFALIVALIVYVLLQHTPFGRYLHATGAGREAARLAGVRTSALLALAFITSGLIASLAGLMQTAILSSANPNVGAQYLLPAFAACFLGATAFTPGRFNVPGTLVALFVLAIGIAGLTQLGAPLWVSPVFNGLALIIAVGLSIRRRDRAVAAS